MKGGRNCNMYNSKQVCCTSEIQKLWQSKPSKGGDLMAINKYSLASVESNFKYFCYRHPNEIKQHSVQYNVDFDFK
jgi:hypothetical protein